MAIPSILGMSVRFKHKDSCNDEYEDESVDLPGKIRTRKYNLTLNSDDLRLIDEFAKSESCPWNRSEFLEEAMRRVLLDCIQQQPASLFLAVKADAILADEGYQFDIPWAYQVLNIEIQSLLNEESKDLIQSVEKISGDFGGKLAPVSAVGIAAGVAAIVTSALSSPRSHLSKELTLASLGGKSIAAGAAAVGRLTGNVGKSLDQEEQSSLMHDLSDEELEEMFAPIVSGGWRHVPINNELKTKTVGLRPRESTFAMMDVISKWSKKNTTLSSIFQTHLSTEIEKMILSYLGTDLYKEGIVRALDYFLNKDFKPNEGTVLGRFISEGRIKIDKNLKEILITD